jgi:hypothetical protein
MYNFELQALVSKSKLSDFWEQRLKPEKVNDIRQKYLSDAEEMEYWQRVFGERETELITESDKPF